MIRKFTVVIGTLLFVFGSLGSHTVMAGDVEKGEKVFKKCKACHYVDQENNKTGPHLVGLFGRTAGSVEGYKYSAAMKDSGIVWSEDTLAEYLKAPKKYVKGTKMAFAGLKKDADLDNIIAYLKSFN
jgi:cytochrome c2